MRVCGTSRRRSRSVFLDARQIAPQVLRGRFCGSLAHFNCNGGTLETSVDRLRILSAKGDYPLLIALISWERRWRCFALLLRRSTNVSTVMPAAMREPPAAHNKRPLLRALEPGGGHEVRLPRGGARQSFCRESVSDFITGVQYSGEQLRHDFAARRSCFK